MTFPMIVIVDDEELVRAALAMVLERNGYQTTSFSSAKQALASLNDLGRIDAIITDLVMPVMDGVLFIKRLREIGVQSPIITLTGGARVGQHNMSIQAKEAGAAVTLQKPVDKNQLLSALENVFNL
ncbi:response regulator [Terasakiella pusilla]|uniref:response regulator n=1 Tax=Terasakiella pusilla TaxID=64973 RepID=UPI003AA98BA2